MEFFLAFVLVTILLIFPNKAAIFLCVSDTIFFVTICIKIRNHLRKIKIKAKYIPPNFNGLMSFSLTRIASIEFKQKLTKVSIVPSNELKQLLPSTESKQNLLSEPNHYLFHTSIQTKQFFQILQKHKTSSQTTIPFSSEHFPKFGNTSESGISSRRRSSLS